MPTCQNCEKEWSWSQTFKTQFRFNPKCPYCEKKQYIASTAKTKMFNFFPLIIFPISYFFNHSWLIAMILFVLLLVTMVSIYPFLIKLSNEENLPW